MKHHEAAMRRKAMAEYVDGGASVKEAAAHFNVNVSMVYEACRRGGVPSKTLPLIKDRSLRVIADLVNTDVAYHELARRYGVSYQYIQDLSTRCRSAGIPVKERPKGKPKTGDQDEPTRSTRTGRSLRPGTGGPGGGISGASDQDIDRYPPSDDHQDP